METASLLKTQQQKTVILVSATNKHPHTMDNAQVPNITSANSAQTEHHPFSVPGQTQ
jgi:hypothetical protein